ncbi:DNA repair protein XRCC2 homolog [Pistacia vera]|uniref:DNA repair protein XRCC2 homolog n=1 Tax=Pistacia vera TaxID=55513 RepID=UPI0012637E58|nr:DNA repair protein XRCC2 homolog [Pistacia vera]
MALKGWIEGDESADEMLSRLLTEGSPFFFLPPLHRLPLRVGNVLELVGPSTSAKTQILIQAAISCILPKEWNGVHYGGLGRLVTFLDLDCRFDVSCLAQLLKHRIMEANGLSSKEHREQQLGDLSNCDAKRQPNMFYDEELFAVCMRRFLYVRCYESFEFLTTLKIFFKLALETFVLLKSQTVMAMKLLIARAIIETEEVLQTDKNSSIKGLEMQIKIQYLK